MPGTFTETVAGRESIRRKTLEFPEHIDGQELTMAILEWQLVGMIIAPLSESVWIVTTSDVKEIVLYEETICGWTQTGDVQQALTREMGEQIAKLENEVP